MHTQGNESVAIGYWRGQWWGYTMEDSTVTSSFSLNATNAKDAWEEVLEVYKETQ